MIRAQGATALYVTHDQAEALTLGDRLVVMDRGRIAQVGTPRDVYYAPASDYVAGFFGPVNRLDGTCDLYGPAPQSLSGEGAVEGWGGRSFEPLLLGRPEAEADDRIARERNFDSDLWLVEIDDRKGRIFVD